MCDNSALAGGLDTGEGGGGVVMEYTFICVLLS